jgi:hypothetical protein
MFLPRLVHALVHALVHEALKAWEKWLHKN